MSSRHKQEFCGALTASGSACSRQAGWGLPGMNTGTCRDHGGHTAAGLSVSNPSERMSTAIQACLVEYQMLRNDSRSALSTQASLLTAVAAFFGALAVVASDGEGLPSMPDPIWFCLPIIPFALSGWILYLGQQNSLRTVESLGIERFLARQIGVSFNHSTGEASVATDPKRTDHFAGDRVPVASHTHLLLPHLRAFNGNHAATYLLCTGVFTGVVSLAFVTYLAVYGASELPWRIATGVFYGCLIGFFLLSSHRNFVAPRKHLEMSLRMMSDSASR